MPGKRKIYHQKPTLLHYVLAHWFPISFFLPGVLGTAFLLWRTYPYFAFFNSPLIIAQYTFGILLSFPIFCIVGLVIIMLGGAHLFNLMKFLDFTLNGAPLEKGDTVQILCGPRRGEVRLIERAKPNYGSIYFKLEPEDKVTNKFGYFDVCRIAPRP